MQYSLRQVFVAGVLAGSFAAAACAEDLSRHYRAALEFSEPLRGYAWTCEPADVWELRSFHYSVDDELRVEAGPCTVVFGTHERNPLWAAIIARGQATVLYGADGKPEPLRHIWLRFHPKRVAELFPAETVIGHGDAALVRQARRLAQWKLSGSYHAGGLPAVPKLTHVILDIDTQAGVRRFFGVDEETKNVNAIDAFAKRPLPETPAIDEAAAARIFDEVWKAFDEEYAMFTIKPNVNWDQARAKFRPQALEARTEYDLAAVLSEMLTALEDLHVYVTADTEYVPGFSRERPMNGNRAALEPCFGKLNQSAPDLAWGRSRDNIGYINVYRLADDKLPENFDAALVKLGDCGGLIVDLRFNGGGSETLAQKIAGRFADEPRIYSRHRYRTGPEHAELGPIQERSIEPRGERFEKPVIVLQGRRTMSSAESFALMMAQCPQVTTVGDNTAGSSGNPRRLTPGGSIAVNLPRWLDMTPDGKPIDGVGVPPKVRVEAPESEFTGTADPVLERAIELLKKPG